MLVLISHVKRRHFRREHFCREQWRHQGKTATMHTTEQKCSVWTHYDDTTKRYDDTGATINYTA